MRTCQGIFLLWHVFCRHLWRMWRRVKPDTIQALFLRKWGRFHQHQELSLIHISPPERPPRLLSRLEPFMGAGAGCRITGLPPFFLPSTKSRGILYATFNYPLHFLMRPFMKNIPLLSRAPRFSHMLLAVLASVVFGGCSPSQKAAPQPEPTVPLTGMVTYRARMALPPDCLLYTSRCV